MAFYLAESLESPYVVLIDIKITFATESENIRLLITELLLRAAAGDLARLKKQQYWTLRNAVLLTPFIMEAEILDRGMYVGDLLKIFTGSITEREE